MSIPTNQSLRTFEAAARHLSFKLAAQELSVTPTAVSHQIRTLETRLGRRLFERRTREVDLTPAGHELFHTLRKAFNDIDACIDKLTRQNSREVVTLGLGPIIGTRWLAPQLGNFWQQHPDIDLRLHHTPLPLRHSVDNFDLALAWGNGHWPSMNATLFIKIQVTPVMSPSMPLPDQPEQLLHYPLLHQRDRHGWRQWVNAGGVDMAIQDAGTVIDDTNLVLQTALDGQGVALGVLPFIEDDLNEGRLVRPFELAVDPGLAYYLIYSRRKMAKPAARMVRDWLLSRIGNNVES